MPYTCTRAGTGSPVRRRSIACYLVVSLLTLVPSRAFGVSVDWVLVGSPGNIADAPASNCYAAGCGSVGYEYFIAKYEITNDQYVEFLDAKAAADPLGLYAVEMGMSVYGGILRAGAPGSYTYSAKIGMGRRPVNFVSFYDALRFANWLENGQGSGSTEEGAYTLLGGSPTPSNWATVTRNPGAVVFLPSENEWYKAAYYDSTKGIYYDFPARTNAPTACVMPTSTANTANCRPGGPNTPTDAGVYSGSPGTSGTFDQGGNVWEWNEEIVGGAYPQRGQRGGAFDSSAVGLAAGSPSSSAPQYGYSTTGFRVAMIPEPATASLVAIGLAALAGGGRRRCGRRG